MGLGALSCAHTALPVAAVQNEYSMLWRVRECEVIPTCEELGIGFVPWSPLGVQFLSGWIDANTSFVEGDIRSVESRFSRRGRKAGRRVASVLHGVAERPRETAEIGGKPCCNTERQISPLCQPFQSTKCLYSSA